MINIEDELNKHKNCRDRDELGRLVKEYKNLALQHANNIVIAGQYNKVALKLQEICNKIPAPPMKKLPGNTRPAPVKTVTITDEENARISAAWNQKAGNAGKSVKR